MVCMRVSLLVTLFVAFADHCPEANGVYMESKDTYKEAFNDMSDDEQINEKQIMDKVQYILDRSQITLYETLMGKVLCCVVLRQSRRVELGELQEQFVQDSWENLHMSECFQPRLYDMIEQDLMYTEPASRAGLAKRKPIQPAAAAAVAGALPDVKVE